MVDKSFWKGIKMLKEISQKIGNGSNYNPEVGVTLELQPVISDRDIEVVEEKLGIIFPEVIKRIYSKIGNGGFGPGYGILGLMNGWTGYTDETADVLYQQFCHPDDEDLKWQWPRQLFPYCYWGCTIYSCLDCNKETIITCDTSWRSIEDPMGNIFLKKEFGIEEWFEMWLNDLDIWQELTKYE